MASAQVLDVAWASGNIFPRTASPSLWV